MLKKVFICVISSGLSLRTIAKQSRYCLVVTLLAIIFSYNLCFAKDLSEKTGIGFNSQLSDFSVNSFSIRYWFSQTMAIEGLLGFSLGDDTVFDIGGKFLTILKEEKNLNLYGFIMLGLESYQTTNNQNNQKSDDTSFLGGGGFGVEFFFSDFPNLGFAGEVGLDFTSTTDKSQFGTTAGWLSAVGIRYYL
ncbi:MAG: hypothetical protein ABID79_05045 [Elusimicrobiota bacterium]